MKSVPLVCLCPGSEVYLFVSFRYTTMDQFDTLIADLKSELGWTREDQIEADLLLSQLESGEVSVEDILEEARVAVRDTQD